MPSRGRNYEVYESDDDYSSYVEVPAHKPRSRSRVGIRVVDERFQSAPSPRLQQQKYHHHSFDVGSQYDPEPIVIQNHLNLPTTAASRQRASSTGAAPQPNYIPVLLPQQEREVSQTRIKNHYRKGRRDSDYTSSDDSDYRSSRKHRRSRSKRRASKETSAVDPAILQQLAELKLYREAEKRNAELAEQNKWKDLLAEERKKFEDLKKPSVPPEVAARLEKFNYNEERRAREEAEAALIAKMKDDERRKKEREERIMYDMQESLRRKQQAEQDAVARAEAARAKADAEARAERERLLAAEKEKIAQATLKEKAERARILAESKSQAAAAQAEQERLLAEYRAKLEREKMEQAEERLRILTDERARAEKAKKAAEEERARIVAEEKEKAEKAKRAADEERRRILAEEEERKRKEKAEYEEMRDRVLAAEKKKEEEAKAKKKAEDEAFKARVKEQFKEAGYSPEYIEGILEKKERKEKNAMALEASRPTYIRVQIRHLLPETLEYYHLPWEYDPHDERYILIKEYITHELQQELFQHTKRIYKQRETRLITADGGYVKETTTTLRPNIYKDKDKNEMFLVRRKSTGKSPSRPARNSWMFS